MGEHYISLLLVTNLNEAKKYVTKLSFMREEEKNQWGEKHSQEQFLPSDFFPFLAI